MEQGEWTEADIERILSNPIYVAIGSYPQIIAEDLWIKAQKRRAEEKGIRPTLRTIRTALHETLGYQLPRLSSNTWLDESYKTVAREGLDIFMQRLIAQLRVDLGGPIDTPPVA